MNRVRKFESVGPKANGNGHGKPAASGLTMQRKRFVFFDIKTGARRFEVDAAADGNMPLDQAASLLAIQCVARQQIPRDFDVMVTLEDALVDGLAARAIQLMRTCSGFKSAVPLSRRQHEVLNGVAQNLSNKRDRDEIEYFSAHREIPRLHLARQVSRLRSRRPYAASKRAIVAGGHP